MLKILIGVVAALAVALALQTWRLNRCQIKADRLTTCEAVDEIEKEVRDETDDGLAAGISDP